jgi:hypothetical protein
VLVPGQEGRVVLFSSSPGVAGASWGPVSGRARLVGSRRSGRLRGGVFARMLTWEGRRCRHGAGHLTISGSVAGLRCCGGGRSTVVWLRAAGVRASRGLVAGRRGIGRLLRGRWDDRPAWRAVAGRCLAGFSSGVIGRRFVSAGIAVAPAR